MQEGQAGRKDSRPCHGTENRKEMNRGRIERVGRAKQWVGQRGRRARKSRGGGYRSPSGAPSLGDREAPECGFEAADAAGREKGHGGEEKGPWHRGEVKEGVLPRPQSRGKSRGRKEGKPQSGKARPRDLSDF